MFIATEHLERLKWHTGADGMLYVFGFLCDIRFTPTVQLYRKMCTCKFRVSIGGLPLEVAQLTKNELVLGPPAWGPGTPPGTPLWGPWGGLGRLFGPLFSKFALNLPL